LEIPEQDFELVVAEPRAFNPRGRADAFDSCDPPQGAQALRLDAFDDPPLAFELIDR
jgi:hypothetical protein